MKILNFSQAIALLFIFASSLTSCNQSSEENDKPYTPLYAYFNPLDLDMSMEKLMPYFVNYPSDWVKMGLRSHPMIVTYHYNNSAWGVSGDVKYTFLANGRLSQHTRPSTNVGASGFDVVTLEYDGNSNICRITSEEDGRYKRKHTDNGFVYDTMNRLIRREKSDRANPGTWNYIYEYHENGVLKSIQPEKENVLTSEAGVTLYKSQFDSLGRIERMENTEPTNILLKDISKYKRGKSVTIFSYADNLCSQAIEEIPIRFDNGTENIVCTSSFKYNSHGDMTAWTYSGGVYIKTGNSWRVDDMTFTITYDYVYDEKGNWTQAKIIFPSNLDEIPPLRTIYRAEKFGFVSSQDHSSSTKEGETPFVTVNRTIDYYDEDMIKSQNETSASRMKEEQSEEGLFYKGTDTYGLFSKVKSVTEEREQLKFDQSGNLVYKKNSFDEETTYKYLTPTSYNVSGWGDAMINIKIENGIRSDVDSNINIELNQEYMFDNNKRIVKHIFNSHMAIVTHNYQYKDNSKYPTVLVEEHPRDGITTYHYTYIKFDKKDNWIERKVVYSTEYDEYDDDMNYIGKKQSAPNEYTEKRDIEYW